MACSRIIGNKETGVSVKKVNLIKAVCDNLDAKNWYQDSFNAIEKKHGNNRYLYCRILSATSPLRSIERNVAEADRIIESQNYSSNLSAHNNNLDRIVRGEALNGLKVHNFFRALIGDPNAVTIDRHIFDLFGIKASTNAYYVITDIIRSLATDLELEPRQVQACLWAYQKRSKKQKVYNFASFVAGQYELFVT